MDNELRKGELMIGEQAQVRNTITKVEDSQLTCHQDQRFLDISNRTMIMSLGLVVDILRNIMMMNDVITNIIETMISRNLEHTYTNYVTVRSGHPDGGS